MSPVGAKESKREVIAAALKGQEFLSAQELHARLRASDQRVGLATVYRILQALQLDGELDVLRNDAGEVTYRACESPEHHHHLVCRECGATVEVEGPAVEKWAAAVAQQHGYTQVSHTLEIFGVCDKH